MACDIACTGAKLLANQMNIGYTLAATIAFVGIPSICVLYGGNSHVAKSLGLSWSVAAPACLVWGLVGYSMVFGKSLDSRVFGGDTYAPIDKTDRFNNPAGAGDYSFVYYSFMFAMTALSIIIGGAGVGLGLTTNALQVFMLGSLLLNYCPLAHWLWNAGAAGGAPGWLYAYGVIDYAGGMVLHGYAGTAVLVLGLLSRRPRTKIDYGNPMIITASLGFYVGKQALQVSSGSTDGAWSSLGAYNTIVAAYASATLYQVLSVVAPREGGPPFSGQATIAAAVKGALSGVVAMAAGASFNEPQYAVLSNICSTAVVYLVDFLTQKVNVHGFDVFLLHGVAGFTGSAMIGLFANNRDGRLYAGSSATSQYPGYVGAFFGNPAQLARQCAGISVTILLTVVVTLALAALVHVLFAPFGGAWEQPEEPPIKAEEEGVEMVPSDPIAA